MDNNQQKDNRPGGGRMPNGNKVPFMAILAIALVVILGITMFSGMFRSSIFPSFRLRMASIKIVSGIS